MWGWIALGAVAAVAALYEVVSSAQQQQPSTGPLTGPGKGKGNDELLNVKPPKKLPKKAPEKVAPSSSQGTSVPHVVPGGGWVYTGAQASPSQVQAAADALAAVDPTKRENEQLVRNFEDAAGLAQRPGGPGWDAVRPTGTDGRYGHDVREVLGKYVSNPPPVSPTRPAWWGPSSVYWNR